MQLTMQNISSLYPRLQKGDTRHSSSLKSYTSKPVKKKDSLNFNIKYLDIPGQADPHGPAIIYGVESEEIEEINDAYNDLVEDLGLSSNTDNDLEEIMPSCGPLLVIEYLISKVEHAWAKDKTIQ